MTFAFLKLKMLKMEAMYVEFDVNLDKVVGKNTQ